MAAKKQTRINVSFTSWCRCKSLAHSNIGQPKRAPNAFLLFRSVLVLVDKRLRGVPNARWEPDTSYPFAYCYDLNEWMGRPENGEFLAWLSKSLTEAKDDGAYADDNRGVQAKLSTYASTLWESLSLKDRKRFTDFQDESTKKHRRLHPEYVFSPQHKNNKRKVDDRLAEEDIEGHEEPASKRVKPTKQASRARTGRTPRAAPTNADSATSTRPKRVKRCVDQDAPSAPSTASSSRSIAASPASLISALAAPSGPLSHQSPKPHDLVCLSFAQLRGTKG